MEGITGLYHFTSVENLPGIRDAGALCSKQTLERMGFWPPPVSGGNATSHELDRYNDNWDKVALSFTPYTPMAYHRKRQVHLCFFVLDPGVAALPGVWFTDTNATASDHRRAQGLDGLLLVNFDAIRATPRPWDRDGWHRPVQAEVLVPDRIPLRYVRELLFPTKASLVLGQQLWGRSAPFPFRVERSCFSDVPDSLALEFPNAEHVEVVVRRRDGSTTRSTSRLRRATDSHVLVRAEIEAFPGLRTKVICSPGGCTRKREFHSRESRVDIHLIDVEELPDGACTISYYLDDICWARFEFEVE